jgi:hypothetical protein
MEAKLKHLEFIQGVISRMATNSFLFKGWAITIAAGLSAFAAIDTTRAVLSIALISTAMFWGLDGYYLWLEHRFRDLYAKVAAMDESAIDFSMRFDKPCPFRTWLRTCFRRPHLWLFYGAIIAIDIIGIFVIKGSAHHAP